MKKITLLVLTLILSSAAYSQKMVSLKGGWGGQAAGGSEGASFSAFFYGGGTFETAFSEKASFGGGLDFLTGPSASANTTGGSASINSSWLGIEPKITFYPNEVYRGFFIGSNIAFNMGLSEGAQSYLQIGPRLGWMFPLSDQFRLSLESQFGYAKSFDKEIEVDDFNGGTTKSTIGGGGGIYSRFGLTFGYILGE